jgi:hypothetical protein
MMNLMLSLKWSFIFISSFKQLCQASPPYKLYMILGVLYFWFLTGKSSWVPSRTQGLFPIYCRWPVLLWVLQILPPPCRRWGLDRQLWSLLIILPKMLLVGHDYYMALYLKLWSYVRNYVASAKQTWFVIICLNSNGCNSHATCEML